MQRRNKLPHVRDNDGKWEQWAEAFAEYGSLSFERFDARKARQGRK